MRSNNVRKRLEGQSRFENQVVSRVVGSMLWLNFTNECSKEQETVVFMTHTGLSIWYIIYVLKIYFVFNYVYTCMSLCGYMYVWMQVPTDSKRWRWILWYLSSRWRWAPQCGCWEPTAGSSGTAGSTWYDWASSTISCVCWFVFSLVTVNFSFNFGEKK